MQQRQRTSALLIAPSQQELPPVEKQFVLSPKQLSVKTDLLWNIQKTCKQTQRASGLKTNSAACSEIFIKSSTFHTPHTQKNRIVVPYCYLQHVHESRQNYLDYSKIIGGGVRAKMNMLDVPHTVRLTFILFFITFSVSTGALQSIELRPFLPTYIALHQHLSPVMWWSMNIL